MIRHQSTVINFNADHFSDSIKSLSFSIAVSQFCFQLNSHQLKILFYEYKYFIKFIVNAWKSEIGQVETILRSYFYQFTRFNVLKWVVNHTEWRPARLMLFMIHVILYLCLWLSFNQIIKYHGLRSLWLYRYGETLFI